VKVVCVSVALAATLAAAVVLAGCGGTSTASPIHQVNVFFDGMGHNDFRQACSVVKGFPSVAECENYFTVSTAISGGGATGHAVPHSEKITGATATARAVDSRGTRYVVTLAKLHGRWVLTSVSAV